jgi:hypothetical protein
VSGQAPSLAPLTTAQRWLAAGSGVAGTALAALGGFESYGAVRQVAVAHDFTHPALFPLGVDTAVCALFLAELLLAWLNMPFPPLRWGAWALVGATIWWNAAASAGNVLGMAMHATAPLLVVVWIESIRHAVRVRAQMAARRHIEASPLGRWLLAPVATARLWRTQQLWHIANYADALALERRRLLAIGRLRAEHGRLWRWKAPVMKRLVLRLGLEAETAPLAPPPSDLGPMPAELARTFVPTAALERPALATTASRPTVRARHAGAKARRGGRTDKALEFIHTQRTAGAERPDDLHIVLHRDFGLERTQARRFAERHWPATDPSGGGEAAAEEGAA